MASDGPPSYYFNGIDFNSNYFSSSAYSPYLKKNVPDIANALETFNGGVVITNGLTVDTISPTVSASSPSQIGWTQGFTSPITKTTLGNTTGASTLYSFDTGGITTGTQLPIGIYLVTMNSYIIVPSGLTSGTITNYVVGYAMGLNYNFAGLTRNQLINAVDANYGVIAKVAGQYPLTCSQVVKNTVANNYIAGYMLLSFSVALVGGTMTGGIGSYSLTRIG